MTDDGPRRRDRPLHRPEPETIMGRVTGIVAILGCYVSYKVGVGIGREEAERRSVDDYLRGSRGECLRYLKEIDDAIRKRKERAGDRGNESEDVELAEYRELERHIARIIDRSDSLRTLKKMPWLWKTYDGNPAWTTKDTDQKPEAHGTPRR